MALQSTSTSGEYLTRTATVINHNAANTAFLWVRLDSDANTYVHFLHIGGNPDAYDGNTDFLGTDADGTTLRFGCAGGASNTFTTGPALTVGDWYWLALVRESATSLKVYIGTDGTDGSLLATITDNVSGRASATAMRVLSYNGFGTVGTAAHARFWTRALTLAELHDEAASATVADTANIWSAADFDGSNVADAALDDSGNSRDWTTTGTLDLVSGPSLGPTAPTINTQPQGAGAAVGATAQFAIVSPDATSYQWQVSTNRGQTWANVSDGSGGTTDTYTTPTAIASHNGRKYRCVLTNAGGDTNSLDAFFHVSGLSRAGRASNRGFPDAQTFEGRLERSGSFAPGTWYAFRSISGINNRDFATAARQKFFQEAPPPADPALAIWSNKLKAELPSGYGTPLSTLRQKGMPAALLIVDAFSSATLSASGIASASFTSAAIDARAFGSNGVAAATFAASGIYSVTLASAGVGAASFSAAGVVSSSLSSSGVAAVSFAGLDVESRNLSSTGVAAASWSATQIESRTLSSSGVASVTIDGQDSNSGLAPRTLTSDGVASVSWQAAAFQAVNLATGGVGSFSALVASIEPRALSSSGVAAVSFDGSNAITIESRTLGSAGVASVSFIGIDTEAQAGFAGFDVDFESPLWWKRKKDDPEPEEPAQQTKPVKPNRPGSEAIAKAKQIIAETAREHVERGTTVPKSARFAEVRSLLKPLGRQAMQFNWPDLYQRLYQQALHDALRTELELEATLEALRVEEEDLALEMLLLEA